MSTEKNEEIKFHLSPDEIRITDKGGVEIYNLQLAELLRQHKVPGSVMDDVNLNCGSGCNNYCPPKKSLSDLGEKFPNE
jgi:hypothetical protein